MTTTTKSLAAYALAATMIGGSLFGAASLLTGSEASPADDVQIIQATDTEPSPLATTIPAVPAQTAPPVTEPLEAAPPVAVDPAENPGAMAEDEEYDDDNEHEGHDDD
jgi:hypothetical protein